MQLDSKIGRLRPDAARFHGVKFMKTLTFLALATLAAAALTGCSRSSPAASVAPVPPPAAVTSLSMPKSVSVVTAN